ncbi:MAG: DUF1566 domain-containing protein [Rikenellaceae bacterium]|nr:DUF1566 domain-containing protein [Rikenellaceae bacterium]
MEFPAVGWRYGDSSGSLYGAGAGGRYWSSVAYDSYSAYLLYFDSGDLYVGSRSKQYGFSVRCVR